MPNLKTWLATLLLVGAGCYVFGYCSAPRPKPNADLLLLQATYARRDSAMAATLDTFRQQTRALADTVKAANAAIKAKAAEADSAHRAVDHAKRQLASAATVRDSLTEAIHVIWEQETEIVSLRATIEEQGRAMAALNAMADTLNAVMDSQAMGLANARHLIHEQVKEIDRLSSRPKGWSGSTGFLFGVAVGVAAGATVIAVAK